LVLISWMLHVSRLSLHHPRQTMQHMYPSMTELES
jgi:hypothetical protein